MLKKYTKKATKEDSSKPIRVPTVTVCFTGLRFNVSAITQLLCGFSFVELFYDEKGAGFGIKLIQYPMKGTSYEIKRYRQGGKVYTARVYCSSFVKKLGFLSGVAQTDKIYPLKLDKEKSILMVEFDAYYV